MVPRSRRQLRINIGGAHGNPAPQDLGTKENERMKKTTEEGVPEPTHLNSERTPPPQPMRRKERGLPVEKKKDEGMDDPPQAMETSPIGMTLALREERVASRNETPDKGGLHEDR